MNESDKFVRAIIDELLAAGYRIYPPSSAAPIKTDGFASRGNPKWPKALEDELRHLWASPNITRAEIFAKFEAKGKTFGAVKAKVAALKLRRPMHSTDTVVADNTDPDPEPEPVAKTNEDDMGFFNNPERGEKCRMMASEYYSGGEIASELGCTRNTVIGYCHRNGIRLQRRPGHKPVRRKTSPMVAQAAVPSLKPVPAPEPALAPVVEAMFAAPAGGMTLMELCNHNCRWPLGGLRDSAEFFCGAAADLAAGRPYCLLHSRIAYQPAQARKPSKGLAYVWTKV
jgi:GcrA cell cycle regulator